jgi:hypothetical protein
MFTAHGGWDDAGTRIDGLALQADGRGNRRYVDAVEQRLASGSSCGAGIPGSRLQDGRVRSRAAPLSSSRFSGRVRPR